jgi:hypothetical protein
VPRQLPQKQTNCWMVGNCKRNFGFARLSTEMPARRAAGVEPMVALRNE